MRTPLARHRSPPPPPPVTRIAMLADVHGNMPALEAVVDDIARQRVDEVLVGGDLVGRGPEGRAVLERVRALGWPAVAGNHEGLLLDTRATPRDDEVDVDDIVRCTRWMADELGDAAAAYLSALPDFLVAATAAEVRLVHGSPRSNRQGIGPWTSPEQLRELFDDVPEPILVCAHTHRPLVRRLDDGMVINVGSVGLPFDGDPRASYAVLERGVSGWHADMRRVPYDRGDVLARYRSTGFMAAGGAMAALLAREVETARTHLVPFVAWCEARDVACTLDRVPAFLAEFEPERPIAQATDQAPSST